MSNFLLWFKEWFKDLKLAIYNIRYFVKLRNKQFQEL